ncbi:amino acid ABC transporter permease [Propionimicrobium sp. PCR01-08-3]|uniref:amino acid ABC transporter permease n=1 Tax=Propionimicrobium sp. PCR01-08-3 TaxID=3052086 RepID=UPI00255CCD32|nr:amino acid ABC transporter permease [Propionimicrobium sp. PCR01-08-3]WIY83983.1 amino acid ABC transporter permease [Propionimicrobium sp. PCR01-08-3]
MAISAGSDYRVVKLKHVGRYFAAVVVLAIFAFIVAAFANGQISWDVVAEYFTVKAILTGFVFTLILTVVSMAIGIVLGVIIAVMRLAKNPVVSSVAWIFVWFFRGTPVYLQLLLWFNVALIFPTIGIPGLFEARTVDLVTPTIAAILGLGLNQAAYTAEIVRGGILSVDEGQTEAAKALGVKGFTIMRTVVLPQAMRVILPPIGNEVIGMLKTTSMASAIGASEILNEAQHIYLVNNMIMELLLVSAAWYLIAVSVLSIFQYYIERHFARGSTTSDLPPTPIQRVKTFFGTPGRTK